MTGWTKGSDADLKRIQEAKRLKKIWWSIHTEHVPPESYHPRMGRARPRGSIYTDTRAVTEPEWAFIRKAIKDGFPATIHCHGFGFIFALCVYEPTIPIYPGVPVEPTPLLVISSRQIPGNTPTGNSGDQKIDPSPERPGGVFEIFEAICNTPENLAALKREGLPAPGRRGEYQY